MFFQWDQMASIGEDDPSCHVKMHFFLRRFENAVKNLTPKQRGFLVKHGIDMVLNLKHHVVFPMHLIQFIMENMVQSEAVFKNGNKCIKFDKYMIQLFIGIPTGNFSNVLYHVLCFSYCDVVSLLFPDWLHVFTSSFLVS